MRIISYIFNLKKPEDNEQLAIINKGSHNPQTIHMVYILLNWDKGDYSEKITNEHISKVLKVGMRTIDRVKKRFAKEGFKSVLERRTTRRIYERKSDEDEKPKLVTLCYSEQSKGFAK